MDNQALVGERFMPIAEVIEVTGLCKATIYRSMDRGDFPRPVLAARRSVRWLQSEITAWMRERPRANPRAAEGRRARP